MRWAVILIAATVLTNHASALKERASDDDVFVGQANDDDGGSGIPTPSTSYHSTSRTTHTHKVPKAKDDDEDDMRRALVIVAIIAIGLTCIGLIVCFIYSNRPTEASDSRYTKLRGSPAAPKDRKSVV